jgi:hypothetical protein
VTAPPPRYRRRPPAIPRSLTRAEVLDLMRRGYVRPLEPVPPLHVMARRRVLANAEVAREAPGQLERPGVRNAAI